MTGEETVAGVERTEHLVHLFDDPESLAETVGQFLLDGWNAGETLLVVARPESWARASRVLAANGCPIETAIASGRLTVVDSSTAVAGFLRNSHPVPERFADTIGCVVADLASRGPRLRIYGDMVDILAAHGELASACELEDLWNALGSRYPFTLLCGYLSGHFGDERTADTLRDICGAHHRATAKPTDLLASWLLANRRSQYHTERG